MEYFKLLKNDIAKTHLVLCWFKTSSWDGSNSYECIQEMTFDTGRTKWSIISLYENNANNVISNMTFSLQL